MSMAKQIISLHQLARIYSVRRSCYDRRWQSTLTLESPISAASLDNARPFEEIPGPKSFPLLGTMPKYIPVIGEYSKKHWHDTQEKKFRQFGPIVREEMFPGYYVVHLSSPKDIEAVTRNEGKYPYRNFFLGIHKLRKERPDIYSSVGVAAGNGEEWYNLRSRAQKVMMRPQVMKQYLPQMNVIAEDFIKRMRKLSNDKHQVPDLMNELFRWALESVTYILFVQRMGCLDDNLSRGSRGQQYIRAVNQFFQSMAEVELKTIPIWYFFPKLSPSFRKLEESHNFFFNSAMEFTKQALSNLEKINRNEEGLSLIENLLLHCSPDDAVLMAVDAMAAGIDTTSLTVAYVLRNLAANPDVQRKLQAEIDRVLPDGKPLTPEVMEQLPYLRACIKESMRITPTVQGTTRTLDKDIVLSGYRVPANTQFLFSYHVSSNDKRNFIDADKYIPERWLRNTDSKYKTTESFAFQPFGFGPRMCIGRRIADVEMLTLLTKIMQNFWVENPDNSLEINFQLVLMIKNPLMYQFFERKR